MFPTNLLNPSQKALCLFCAAFGGQQDVKYIRAAGITAITLVDNEAHRLDKVRKAGDTAILADAFALIDELYSQGKKFDIVTTDQWTSQDHLIHGEYLHKLKAICTGYLILGISNAYLQTLPKEEAAQITNTTLIKRSDYTGGIYWRVIDCRNNLVNDDLAQ